MVTVVTEAHVENHPDADHHSNGNRDTHKYNDRGRIGTKRQDTGSNEQAEKERGPWRRKERARKNNKGGHPDTVSRACLCWMEADTLSPAPTPLRY